MKKIIFSTLFLSQMVLASSASNLSLLPYSNGKVLGTIKLNHLPSASGYFKIDLLFTSSDALGHGSRVFQSMNGAYNTYFNKVYLVDRPSESPIVTFSSVNADITFQTCTDKSYSSCSVIDKHDFKIDYVGNTITGIFPTMFDIFV